MSVAPLLHLFYPLGKLNNLRPRQAHNNNHDHPPPFSERFEMELILDYNAAESESDEDDVMQHESDAILCMVCESATRRYKCPRCSIMTCSLECCRQHKIDTGCSGKRDRTCYVGVKEFNDNNLRDDFHFLEDVLQKKGSALRTLKTAFGSTKEPKRAHPTKSSSDGMDSEQKLDLVPQVVKKFVKAAFHRKTKVGLSISFSS